jgi:4-hydroxybenzoate polyprenyltransferase
MGFAFMVSLLREVVKDIEDYQGDNRFGCITFTVKYGVGASKVLALIIAYIALVAIMYVQYTFFKSDFYYLFSAFFLLDILFISVILMLHKASSKSNFSKLALLIKATMLVGILSMILFYFEF